MIVLTIGTFDLLHPGHLELLEGCRSLVGTGGSVIVGVNRDEFVVRYKGRPPLLPLGHRIEVLRALREVDAVFANYGDENSGVLIDTVRPDVLAIGDDWLDPGHDESRYLAQLGITQAFLAERHLGIKYIPRTRGVSTSGLREAVPA